MTTRIVTDGLTFKAQILTPFWFNRWGRMVWRDIPWLDDNSTYSACAKRIEQWKRCREGWKLAGPLSKEEDINDMPPLPRMNSKTLRRVP